MLCTKNVAETCPRAGLIEHGISWHIKLKLSAIGLDLQTLHFSGSLLLYYTLATVTEC